MKKRILLADDNKQSLKLLNAIYQSEGFETLLASDGQEAMKFLAVETVDLIVSDILMPNVDGYYLCYKVRTNERLRDIPIIIYSATYASASEEKMALEMGADMFIRKPAEISVLVSAANKLMANPVQRSADKKRQLSFEIMHQYSSDLISKLEQRNTQLEKMSENLELTISHFQKAEEIANIGHWSVHLPSQESTWSDQTYQIFDLQRDLLHPSYELYLKYVHPDDLARVQEITRKAQEEFRPFSLTHRIITKNGVEKILFSAGNFEFDKNGTAVTLYGVTMDVTTLKTSEQKLMDYHVRHELVSKATNDAIWDWDILRNSIQWNHGIESIFGYKIRQHETTDDWWRSRIHPDDYDGINDQIQKAFDTGQSNLSFQYRYRCANQTYKHVLDRAHIVYKERIPVRMIGAMQDVTEIVQYREGLEKMVTERTHELNEALAKEKELVDLKSKFVSIASHEFKTPLTTISLATGFIRKHFNKLNPDDVERKLQSIEKQVHQMTYLLNDILTIGKSDAGKMQANLAEVDPGIFRKLAEEAVQSRGKGHKLIFEQTCKFRHLLTDEKLIRNIIINLVTNAVKFSPDAESVAMNVVCTDDRLHMRITDHGIGIPPEDQKNLFVSFSRGSNTEAIEGTGLGLSIVKKAVDMLHGTIEVTSEIGKGTSVHVTLPI